VRSVSDLFGPLPFIAKVVKIEVSALSLREPFAIAKLFLRWIPFFPKEAYEEQTTLLPSH